MVQFAGRYELLENQNFKELLTRRGIPEDRAQAATDAKNILKVTVDGQSVTVQADETTDRYNHTFILDGESEQKLPSGTTVKNTAKVEGNTIKVETRGPNKNDTHDGNSTYNFSDTGLEIIYTNTKDGFTAKRIYKRI